VAARAAVDGGENFQINSSNGDVDDGGVCVEFRE